MLNRTLVHVILKLLLSKGGRSIINHHLEYKTSRSYKHIPSAELPPKSDFGAWPPRASILLFESSAEILCVNSSRKRLGVNSFSLSQEMGSSSSVDHCKIYEIYKIYKIYKI